MTLRPSLNDIVVAAAARTLTAHPYLNASYQDGRFELYERVHVGVAVAVGHELFVPVIMDADKKDLAEIAAESSRLLARTRSGDVTASEFEGGTFTVSNLGMFGVTSFQPIINAPQAAILAVGAARRRSFQDGSPHHHEVDMNLTLVSDHRIVYGAQAAAFLSDLCALLTQPARLTVKA